MTYRDRTLTCVACGRSFPFSAGEQAYYAKQGVAGIPERCPECRAALAAGTARVAPAAPSASAPPPGPAPAAQAGRRFERFTARARRVLVLAQEEAQGFQHNYIGTEHLLLGLLREPEGIAARALDALDVRLDQARASVEITIGRGDRPATESISLTPRGKKVIELAHDEARRLNHQHVGTEHLLLGIVAEGEGIAAGILHTLGATPERVRAQLAQVAASPAARAAEPVPAARTNVLTCRVDDADLIAIDTLLEAGVRTTRSEAASWLIHAGIQANRSLFAQVESTVAEIRRLRGQAQSLAQQAMDSAPDAAPGDPDASDEPPADELPAGEPPAGG